MKTISKSKKLILILLTFSILFIALCTSAFASDNSANINISEDIQGMTYIGEVDGYPTWKATIPIEWHSYDETNPKIKFDDCDIVISRVGTLTWRGYITFSAFDLIKELDGKCVTSGMCGSDTIYIYESSLIPLSSITADFSIYLPAPIKSGTQTLTFSGKVNGVLGFGTFGPHKFSYQVNPDMRKAG